MTPRSNLTMSVNNIVENSQNILNYLDKLKEELMKIIQITTILTTIIITTIMITITIQNYL